MQGYLNLKGYGEFDNDNRPDGWDVWLTFVLSPALPLWPVLAAADVDQDASELRWFLPQRRMSATGTKRTSRPCRSMSAFGGKADIAGMSCHWHLAD
jgi:hypothetical protein